MKLTRHVWMSSGLILFHLIFIESVRQFSIKIGRKDNRLTPQQLVAKYLQNAEEWPNEDEHGCVRDCKNGDRRICYYEFIVEGYQAMGVACGNCTLGDAESCHAEQCVMANGVERTVFTINRQIPATKIEVCKGDMIAVNVHNRIAGTSITIHWHGMLMRGTQYMDGVPMVTQCPIPSGSDFVYAFWAVDAGTFFYHTHNGEIRCNGVTGPLIIRQNCRDDPNRHLYHEDNHYMFLQDWTSFLTDNFLVGLPTRPPGVLPESVLINGQGKVIHPDTQIETQTPFKIFHVSRNKRYRFRAIGATCFTCPLRIQIEKHSLTVISMDALDVKSRTVQSILIYPGERYDFVVNCNQKPGNYWIHIKAVGLCIEPAVHQLAILAYDQDPDNFTIIPSSPRPGYDGYDEGIVLNHANSTCQPNDPRICIHTLQAIEVDEELRDREPDELKVTAFANLPLSIDETFPKDTNNWIPFINVAGRIVVIGAINGIQNLPPPAPLLSQYKDIKSSTICQSESLPPRCNGSRFCSCIHLDTIPLNSYVTLIVTDGPRAPSAVNHAAHLHGYTFQVIEIGHFGGPNNVTLNDLLNKQYTNYYPPLKDTVSVPSNGYAVIKFKADNPGIWMFHCHIEAHMNTGMMMAFQVGTFKNIPPVPRNFPKCGNFR